MLWHLLLQVTIAVHFAFLLFVIGGGLLARRQRWLTIPHLTAAAWGIYVEAMPGLICPLTTLENVMASKAGASGYESGFIEHYLVPIIYPDGLTPAMQHGLAAIVLLTNVVVYAWPRRSVAAPAADAM